MRVGVFAKTFPGGDPSAVLAAARAAGFASVQWNMACAGLEPMPEAIPPGLAGAVAGAAARAGVAIAALSGTWNMIHPDPAVREGGLARLGVLLDAAPALGVRLITLCTGTRDPRDPWRHHPDNARPEAWRDLLDMTGRAAALAERAGVTLGIEPEPGNVVTDAAAARRLLDDMRSPCLRIVLDPANLGEGAAAGEHRRIVAEAVDRLADRLALAHAKDRDAGGRVVAAGRGVVDLSDFVARLRGAGFQGDLIAHGFRADEAPAVARHLAGLVA